MVRDWYTVSTSAWQAVMGTGWSSAMWPGWGADLQSTTSQTVLWRSAMYLSTTLFRRLHRGQQYNVQPLYKQLYGFHLSTCLPFSRRFCRGHPCTCLPLRNRFVVEVKYVQHLSANFKVVLQRSMSLYTSSQIGSIDFSCVLVCHFAKSLCRGQLCSCLPLYRRFCRGQLSSTTLHKFL